VAWRVGLGGLASVVLAANAWAAEFRFGINAEVSYKESAAEVREHYAAFLQELGRLTGHKFTFYPVYSDKVPQAVANKDYDFLLIHTHAAISAEKEQGYQVVGFTQDRKNDQVFFLVRPESPAKALKDVATVKMGVPGLQSWATATARGVLRRDAGVAQPTLVATRYQEAVPLMVELGTVGVGVTRAKKLADDMVEKKKLRVLHVSPSMPLNAVIASPGVPAGEVTEVRAAVAKLTQSRAFDGLAFNSLTYSVEQSKALHDFYQ